MALLSEEAVPDLYYCWVTHLIARKTVNFYHGDIAHGRQRSGNILLLSPLSSFSLKLHAKCPSNAPQSNLSPCTDMSTSVLSDYLFYGLDLWVLGLESTSGDARQPPVCGNVIYLFCPKTYFSVFLQLVINNVFRHHIFLPLTVSTYCEKFKQILNSWKL